MSTFTTYPADTQRNRQEVASESRKQGASGQTVSIRSSHKIRSVLLRLVIILYIRLSK